MEPAIYIIWSYFMPVNKAGLGVRIVKYVSIRCYLSILYYSLSQRQL